MSKGPVGERFRILHEREATNKADPGRGDVPAYEAEDQAEDQDVDLRRRARGCARS